MELPVNCFVCDCHKLGQGSFSWNFLSGNFFDPFSVIVLKILKANIAMRHEHRCGKSDMSMDMERPEKTNAS